MNTPEDLMNAARVLRSQAKGAQLDLLQSKLDAIKAGLGKANETEALELTRRLGEVQEEIEGVIEGKEGDSKPRVNPDFVIDKKEEEEVSECVECVECDECVSN